MRIFHCLGLGILAFFLVPSYLLSAGIWRTANGEWVWVNIFVYAEKVTDALNYLISLILWILVGLLVAFFCELYPHLVLIWGNL